MSETAATLYELADFNKDHPAAKSLSITNTENDLTDQFKNGVKSIKMGANAGEWNAHTEPLSIDGAETALLKPGVSYPNPDKMGLGGPVKAMEKLK